MLPAGLFSCWLPSKKKPDTICLIKATGSSFINGSCSKYDDTVPSDLGDAIDTRTFQIMVDRLNGIGSTYWPCGPSILIGTACCPFTLGLSLLIPW